MFRNRGVSEALSYMPLLQLSYSRNGSDWPWAAGYRARVQSVLLVSVCLAKYNGYKQTAA